MNQAGSSDKSSLFMLALAMVIVRSVARNSVPYADNLRLDCPLATDPVPANGLPLLICQYAGCVNSYQSPVIASGLQCWPGNIGQKYMRG